MMKAQAQTAKILSEKYDIEMSSEVFEQWFDSLDKDSKRWYRTAKVGEIAEIASGVLCNTEPNRDEMARPGEWAN